MPGGRGKKTIIDEAKLELLASLGLTQPEMAAVLDCSEDTLQRNYAEVMRIGLNKCRASVRRKQFELAMAGNATMLIWLGKQMLGQKERIDHGLGGPDGGPIQSAITVTFVRANNEG